MRRDTGNEMGDSLVVGEVGLKSLPLGIVQRKQRGERRVRFCCRPAVQCQRPPRLGQPRGDHTAEPVIACGDQRQLHRRTRFNVIPIDSPASAIASLMISTSTDKTRLSCANTVPAI